MVENDSIAHHTGSIEKLRQILRNEQFKAQYCEEKIYVSKQKHIYLAIPMVSFADIRPTDYVRAFWKPKKKGEKRILGYYGDYAIGLTKDWAVQNNVIPVLYTPKLKDTKATLATNNPLACLITLADKPKEKRNRGKTILNVPPIALFCKHYVGPLDKDKNDKILYSFHLEQEWRYVPTDVPILHNFVKSNNDPDRDAQKKKKEQVNKSLKSYLKFDIWHDVTYIVVKSNNTAQKILDLLASMYKNTCSQPNPSVDIKDRYAYLRSCIVTTEQLKNNL